MADIFNLRMARKRKVRAQKEQAAAESRARFGRTRAERIEERLSAGLEQRRHDAHRRGPRDVDANASEDEGES